MHNQKTETFAIQENTRYSFTQIYFFKSQLVNLLSFIQKYELLLTTQSSFQCLNLLLKVLGLLHVLLSISCLNLLLEILPLLPARLHDRGDVLHAGESWGQRPDNHTWYLSQTPQTCLCKKKLHGVNFYIFNAKNWRFFTDSTRKIGVLYRFNAKNWRFLQI